MRTRSMLNRGGRTITITLVPRGRAPFGRHQESRPLAVSNNGSPRSTDFPSLCACFGSSLTNLIGSGLKSIQNRNVVGPGQRSRFLVLTKRSAASGDENALQWTTVLCKIYFYFERVGTFSPHRPTNVVFFYLHDFADQAPSQQ